MFAESQVILQAARILTYSSLSFLIAIWWAPFLIEFLKWLRLWKKSTRKFDSEGQRLQVTKKFYQENEENKNTPRAGGILIWATTIAFALFFWIIFKVETNSTTQFLNFISRKETFIPIGVLFFSAILGFVDDALVTLESGGNYFAGGLKLSQRLMVVTALSLSIGFWFYFKLKDTSVDIFGYILDFSNLGFIDIDLGWMIIPFITGVLLSMWGGSIIDGFDGLAAGVLIPVYLCFAVLSFVGGYYQIATFLMVITGCLCAYLWYNIPPAQFFMGDTGSISLLLTLGVVAILIDKVYILPIAGFLLFLTMLSDVIQIASKKIFKRKFFLAAPLHHDLEARGWLRHQVTMRYWLISIICSVIGTAVGLLIG